MIYAPPHKFLSKRPCVVQCMPLVYMLRHCGQLVIFFYLKRCAQSGYEIPRRVKYDRWAENSKVVFTSWQVTPCKLYAQTNTRGYCEIHWCASVKCKQFFESVRFSHCFIRNRIQNSFPTGSSNLGQQLLNNSILWLFTLGSLLAQSARYAYGALIISGTTQSRKSRHENAAMR